MTETPTPGKPSTHPAEVHRIVSGSFYPTPANVFTVIRAYRELLADADALLDALRGKQFREGSALPGLISNLGAHSARALLMEHRNNG